MADIKDDWPATSVRDYFAGQALAGLLTHKYVLHSNMRESVARDAYAFADAMIARRKEPSDG